MTPDLFTFSTPAAHLGQAPRFSPLILADRLISLAQEADRAGLHDSASRLLGLVYAVLDEEPIPAYA
ncbi:MAG: hypothetical protein M3N26_05025 [Pseudomonadota bacterium]|nr:hypothetical protein [Pseudomonadota bacterium]